MYMYKLIHLAVHQKLTQHCKSIVIQQKKFFFNFIYFWLHWVFIAARGLSLVEASRGYSSLRCTGFSLWRLLLLRSTGPRARGLQ